MSASVFKIGRDSRREVIFTDSAISCDKQSMNYADIRSIAWWASEEQARLCDRSGAWLRLKSQNETFEISEAAWGFGNTFEKLDGFMKMLSFARRVFVPFLTNSYMQLISSGTGELTVGKLRITKQGIISKGLWGETLCRWEWQPVAESVYDGGRWGFLSSGTWKRETLFYFYSPTNGKKVELARMDTREDNLAIADELVTAYVQYLKQRSRPRD